MTRDELVEALRLHAPEITEAEEWRPLADHVLELVERGLLRPTPPKGSEIEKAREFLATMLQNDSTERVTLAALDALVREPVLLQRIEQARAEGPKKNAVHYTHLSRAEHGWAVWLHDYKVCEHSEQGRAIDCAAMLDAAIRAAQAGYKPGQFCPEQRHPGYRGVWISDEAVEALREWVRDGVAPDSLLEPLTRDLADVLRERG